MDVELIVLIFVFIIPIGSYFYRKFIMNKYAVEDNLSNLNGFDVARKILDENNMENVLIFETRDSLKEKYEFQRKNIKLTQRVFNESTITSTVVAAFEAAHASLDRDNHVIYRIREMAYPAFMYASSFGYIIALLGFLTSLLELYYVGIAFSMFGIVFALLTISVDIESKKRAITLLKENGLMMQDEEDRMNEVFNVCILTNIANLIGELVHIVNSIIDYFKKD